MTLLALLTLSLAARICIPGLPLQHYGSTELSWGYYDQGEPKELLFIQQSTGKPHVSHIHRFMVHEGAISSSQRVDAEVEEAVAANSNSAYNPYEPFANLHSSNNYDDVMQLPWAQLANRVFESSSVMIWGSLAALLMYVIYVIACRRRYCYNANMCSRCFYPRSGLDTDQCPECGTIT